MLIRTRFSHGWIVMMAMLALAGCSNDSMSPDAGRNNGGKSRSLLSLPDIENADNYFYAGRTSASISLSNFVEPEVRQLIEEQGKETLEQEWAGQSLVYFSDGNNAADAVSLNGRPYEELRTDDGQVSYELGDADISTGGGGNEFSWTKDGQDFAHTFGPGVSDVSITAPEFNSTVNASDPLTVSWEPSPDEDFVKVLVRGKLNSDSPEGTEVGYLESDYIGDDGGYTFDNLNQLIEAGSTSATVTVIRGSYEEAEYGGEKYLFIIYSQKSIDINIQ